MHSSNHRLSGSLAQALDDLNLFDYPSPSMAKEEGVEVEGTIVERLRNSRFRVKLPGDHMVLAYLSGKMRHHAIRILEGDTVRLLLSPYDLTQGRIVYRVK